MSNDISGHGYRFGRSRIDVAYSFDPTAQADVQHSRLAAGEYDDSKVRRRDAGH